MAKLHRFSFGLLLFGAQATVSLREKFQAWATEHGKVYDGQATEAAFNNFRNNDEIINRLNSDPEDTAEYGHSRFSDMSPEDFRRTYLPLKMDQQKARQGSQSYTPEDVHNLPDAVDWRDKGAVSPVKDQAACGSCWAESAVGNVESQWFLSQQASGMKEPVSLSVEQVLECDEHDNACYGGFPKGAYEYIIEHGGLAAVTDYPDEKSGQTICLPNQTFNETCGDGMCDDPPLTSYCDLTCSDKKHQSAAHISSWQALPSDEEQMAAYLATHGPISVCLDAGGPLGAFLPWLQYYKRGVANPRFCSQQVDHAVLAVGYGEEKGVKYWTIKNSWGAKWGESGYFRLIRDVKKCGIDTIVSTAIVGKDGNSTFVV